MARAIIEILRRATGSFGTTDSDLQSINLQAVAVTTALAGLSTASVAAFARFDQARANLSTLGADTDAFTASLTDLSNELDNNVSRTELLTSSYDVVSAGFTEAAEAQEILRASYQAAAGNQGELDATTQALTKTLNAYQLEASEAARVSDLLAFTIQRGQTTLGALSPQIGRFAGLAASAGVTLEEAFGSIAVATAQGAQTTEQAVTGLVGVLNTLLSPSAEAQEIIEGLGFASGEALVASEGYAGALRLIAENAEGSAAELSKVFNNTRALNTALAIINNESDFASFLGEAGDQAGLAAQTFEQASDTIGSSFESLRNTVLETAERVGEGVADVVEPVVGLATAVLSAINQLDPAVLRFVGQLTAIGTAVGAVVVALPVLTAGLGAAATALGLLLSPIGLITVGVIALIPLGRTLGSVLAEITGNSTRAADAVTELAASFDALADAARAGELTSDEFRRFSEELDRQVELGRISAQQAEEQRRVLIGLAAQGREAAAAAEEEAAAQEELAAATEAANQAIANQITTLEGQAAALQNQGTALQSQTDAINSQLTLARERNETEILSLQIARERAGTDAERARIDQQISDATTANKLEELRIEERLAQIAAQRQVIAAQIAATEAEIATLKAQQEGADTTALQEAQQLADQNVQLAQQQLADLEAIFDEREQQIRQQQRLNDLQRRNAQEQQAATQRQQATQQRTGGAARSADTGTAAALATIANENASATARRRAQEQITDRNRAEIAGIGALLPEVQQIAEAIPTAAEIVAAFEGTQSAADKAAEKQQVNGEQVSTEAATLATIARIETIVASYAASIQTLPTTAQATSTTIPTTIRQAATAIATATASAARSRPVSDPRSE